MDKLEIRAFHETATKRILEKFGVYDQIINGDYTCIFCGAKVTIDNIFAIFPYKSGVKFCCENLDCRNASLESEEFND